MKQLFIFILFSINFQICYSQTSIELKKQNGVYYIPCKVNGLKLDFIFDSGASDVTISLDEALFMIKNGYLTKDDLKGTNYYKLANGEIQKGTQVNLEKIEIGGRILYNVKASIIHKSAAPLLLGQSALSKLGLFTFDYSNNTLNIFDSLSTKYAEPTTTKIIKNKRLKLI